MLTKKQIWRRVIHSSNYMSEYREEANLFYELNCKDNNIVTFPIISNILATIKSFAISLIFTNEQSIDEESEEDDSPNVSTVVKFDDSVKVILIPSRNEYHEAKLANLLWWENKDYSKFKDQAHNEVVSAVNINDSCGFREAMTLLYQPEYDLNDLSKVNVQKSEEFHKIIHLFQ
mmetsp:Transcript_17356/g.15649  ORF Transcript_17356/g.15649 Transcript_17356/m.15649 type:complete len:175 (-) Transcript_17356:193-717(-)